MPAGGTQYFVKEPRFGGVFFFSIKVFKDLFSIIKVRSKGS
jgi:hypothetical protein